MTCSPPPHPMEAAPRHPLDVLTIPEIGLLRAVLESSGYGGETKRYSYVSLREPTREALVAFAENGTLTREVGVLVTDIVTKTVTELCVDLTARSIVLTRHLDPAVDGWSPIFDEDYDAAATICVANPAYVAALGRRGIVNLDEIVCAPLSAGVFGHEDEVGRRMLRVLTFHASEPDARYGVWAHPVEGLVAYVDLLEHQITKLIDTGFVHVPAESGAYLNPAVAGPAREDMKPLRITQPEGPSFTYENNVLSWQGWSIRIGFNGREGLTLHDIAFQDGGRRRSIIQRASISEMVVPYGEPSRTHEWQNYFDAGEYQYGRLANSLELGCDCLGEIKYLDVVVVDDFCNPITIRNAICIHEEDFGVLWKHTDPWTKKRTTRRQRRLVVSFFVTVGNYDYGFFWYFYLDGRIELEVKATGIVFTSGLENGATNYATILAPNLGAPVHQHMFSARLDMAIDGLTNHVDEINVARIPMGPENPYGNAFTRTVTRLKDEKSAQRNADNTLGRVWRIGSNEAVNRFGEPTGYVLCPESQPLLLAAADAPIRKRATFATKSLWVTPFARDELWAAGYTPNQHPGGAGLPAYVADNRPVDGKDIVIWHTFGLTHFPRSEDWPIMPVDYAGFALRPENFFDRNPTLNVPEDPNGARCHRDRTPAST